MGSFDGENSNRRLQRVDEANTMQSTDDVGDSEIEIRPLISRIFKETFVQYTLNIHEFWKKNPPPLTKKHTYLKLRSKASILDDLGM